MDEPIIWEINVEVITRVIEELGFFIIVLPSSLDWSRIFSGLENSTRLVVPPVKNPGVDMNLQFKNGENVFCFGLIGRTPNDSSELQNLQLVGELLGNQLVFVYSLSSQSSFKDKYFSSEVLFLTGKIVSNEGFQKGALNLSECWHSH